jgi:hypothetical protein
VSNTHGKVVCSNKLAKGGFNRVITLTFQDGFEMIAKIPYHIVVPRYYATASEAATLTFLRLQGIPVPEVYVYSANRENPVGTEYILLEKAPGVSLLSKWLNLEDDLAKRLAQSFVELKTKIFQMPFSATGSIYFKEDIAREQQAPLYRGNHVVDTFDERTDQFCIAHIADYMFWYGRRVELELNRGPWKSWVGGGARISREESHRRGPCVCVKEINSEQQAPLYRKDHVAYKVDEGTDQFCTRSELELNRGP